MIKIITIVFPLSMTMTSNNPSINISVATKYLDPGERGAQVIMKYALTLAHTNLNENTWSCMYLISLPRMCVWCLVLFLLEATRTQIIGILHQGDRSKSQPKYVKSNSKTNTACQYIKHIILKKLRIQT